MLYNSYAFLLVFLPAVLALHFGVFCRLGARWALGWLATASLAFYAYWRPPYVLLILASMLANYGVGRFLSKKTSAPADPQPVVRELFLLALVLAGVWAGGVGLLAWAPGRAAVIAGTALTTQVVLSFARARRRGLAPRRLVATLAVAANLGLLAYFKYVHFLSESASAVLPIHWIAEQVVLPLGISFFTFEQIGYVVDAFRGEARDYSFVEYFFFVTFFPHLIAGPIIVHKELLGQVGAPGIYRLRAENLACGLSLFVLGLAKKVLVADTLAGHATSAFARAQGGTTTPLVGAWVALLAYALQLYFDFSGYSDMGLGLARMLNFKLPLNFDSPYKAANIIDFWRRWHMTLSRFLREMLYIPLGGNRHGTARRHLNLGLTMVLGGLWHGAGWNFLVWGGLHGLYLVVNHSWQSFRRARLPDWRPGRWAHEASVLLTFAAVLLGWVFFRAESASAALTMLWGLGGGGGVEGGAELTALLPGAGLCLAAYLVARLAPNSQEILAPFDPALPAIETSWRTFWSFRPACAALVALLAAASILGFTHVSEFLYFQF